MVVVSTRDFRTNQTKYLNLAKAGEHVVLKSRAGSFRIFPEDEDGDTIKTPRELVQYFVQKHRLKRERSGLRDR